MICAHRPRSLPVLGLLLLVLVIHTLPSLEMAAANGVLKFADELLLVN